MRQLFYRKRKFFDDDFDWDTYTPDTYDRRLMRSVRPVAPAAQLGFDAESGTIRSEGAALHPNQQLILEVIGRLRPATVHEVGCGSGDLIASVKSVFPEVAVTAGERGAAQLDLAVERHPDLKGQIGLQDITMPFCHRWPRAELVYTQAVVMHLHTAVSHFVAVTANVACLVRRIVLV